MTKSEAKAAIAQAQAEVQSSILSAMLGCRDCPHAVISYNPLLTRSSTLYHARRLEGGTLEVVLGVTLNHPSLDAVLDRIAGSLRVLQDSDHSFVVGRDC